MTNRQPIVPVRREYNRWVANQTLEDFALRFTATRARRWSNARVAHTALGAISFLALEAIGAAITINYGFTNAVCAIVSVSVLIFLTGLPISYYAAKYGVDMDLLTRGAGFGYIGSTITSLLYASFTFIFFALEAAIMAHALKLCLGIPLSVGYVVSTFAVIPLVTHGITLISRFQVWTQPLWLALHALPFAFIAWRSPELFGQWTSFAGHRGDGDGSFNLFLFGAAASVAMALVVQIGEQVDFLRFLQRPQPGGRKAWMAALVAAGPGWIVPGMLKLLAGSFLAFLALQHEVPLEEAVEPTQLYLTAFGYVFAAPEAALAATGLFVVVSQLKINVTNAYAGSIAWSNFFARLTQSHPGRVVWVVFNAIIALLLTELGIFKALETILGLYAHLAIAWVGALVADLVVNKPLRLSPRSIEFKRAHLYDINPVGIGAMTAATVIALSAYAGALGEACRALSAFVAFGAAFVAAPAIALATRGKYYLARRPRDAWQGAELLQCRVCEHRFEPSDMAHCPAYADTICSLCCSLDARCHDVCKEGARWPEQLRAFLGRLVPAPLLALLDSQLGHYLARFAAATGLIAAVFGVVYFQETLSGDGAHLALQQPFFKAFMILTLVAGVMSWLSVLAQDSRRIAQEESTRQNQLLVQEIEAHRKTDAELKRAKEQAEAANLAKSRYISGVSHELRTPLNAILGYAQLLAQDEAIAASKRAGLRVVKRSAEHLSVLIDGLLDMAGIEAGRLVLRREPVALPELIEELVQMFDLQARAKGLALAAEIPQPLPEIVYSDQKRLRQILINLLSNAIKYTEEGSVVLRVEYRRPLAEFIVRDTGRGIEAADMKRIFEPFERGATADGVPGTGLGLTISKLLAQVMGGELTVTSTPGAGSTFRVRLFLTAADSGSALPQIARPILGYAGPRRRILVVDDDPVHRMLMREVLVPLGFVVAEAATAQACLDAVRADAPDAVLLDISLPGASGWSVLETLRAVQKPGPCVIVVSANAYDGQQPHEPAPAAFLAKPVVLTHLLDLLQRHLALEWIRAPQAPGGARPAARSAAAERLQPQHVQELIALGRIGYVRGIEAKLAALEQALPDSAVIVGELAEHVRGFRIDRFLKRLEDMQAHED